MSESEKKRCEKVITDLWKAVIPTVPIEKDRIYFDDSFGTQDCVYNHESLIIKEWRSPEPKKSGSVVWHTTSSGSRRLHRREY